MAKAKAAPKKTQGPVPVLPGAPTAMPSSTTPPVPANFQALTPKQVKELKKVTAAQAAAAGGVANEIKGAPGYANDFGAKAVSQAAIGNELMVAAAWHAEAENAARWASFTHTQSVGRTERGVTPLGREGGDEARRLHPRAISRDHELPRRARRRREQSGGDEEGEEDCRREGSDSAEGVRLAPRRHSPPLPSTPTSGRLGRQSI